MPEAKELRICLDVGSKRHRVLVGLSTGEVLECFDMTHTSSGIEGLFAKIEDYKESYSLPVCMAMEAYNGHVRPIDEFALEKGYRLLNVNNHKVAQFKKLFPSPAKSDDIDVNRIFNMLSLDGHLTLEKNVLNDIKAAEEVNDKLKYLTRRRDSLVQEKIQLSNRMTSDLRALSPGLLDITNDITNQWFLNFLTSRDDFMKLSRLKKSSLLKIKGIGVGYAQKILTWQEQACFSHRVSYTGSMVQSDAKRLLELKRQIAQIEKELEELIPLSTIASRLLSIPGFGKVSAAAFAGEVGTLERFEKEASLAIYSGMGVLTNSSGEYEGAKAPRHVNRRLKRALMTAVARHKEQVEESERYYKKKRDEGKKHNQAIRSLGRHLIRVIWSMLTHERDYERRKPEANA